MSAGSCASLQTAVDELNALGVSFALVHESALMGWGIDNNAFLACVDVLFLQNDGFEALGCGVPSRLGEYEETKLAGLPLRLWSRCSLGIQGAVEVTACAHYGCEALAPELVLKKLPYSPDARILLEQRARLAAILMADKLSDEELALVARYVRGE